MSGGYFGYNHYRISDIIDTIDEDSDNFYCRDNEGYKNLVKKSDAISIQY